MKLFRYILKDFFKYVLGTCALCMFLFVLFDFIHKTTRYFQKYNPSTENIVLLYIYQIPHLLVQAIPIASLLGSVTCMVLMSRTNEITAMRAAGMGPVRVGLPVAIGGLILSALSILLGEFIAPKSMKQMRYVEEVVIEGSRENQMEQGAHWAREENFLFSFEEFNP